MLLINFLALSICECVSLQRFCLLIWFQSESFVWHQIRQNLCKEKSNINYVLNQFNSFDKNLKFTINTLENIVPHFLDIDICPNELGIYCKHTQTGQYVHITSYTLWRWKTSWIHSLLIRANKICSANYFNNETAKLSYFTKTKVKISLLSQSSVVYKFVCPGCGSSYIGKTERTLWERTEEHAYKNNNQKEQSALYERLSTCEHYSHMVDLFKVDNNSFSLYKFNICQIRNNTTVIDKANNWNTLLFKEACMIKTHRPSLDCGLKASKELQLFKVFSKKSFSKRLHHAETS